VTGFGSKNQASWKGVALFAAAVGALDYLFTAWTWIGWNRRPGFAQDPWLIYARGIRDGLSVPMGNDHPLYPFVLSLWASPAPEAFTYSKLLSLALGVLTVVWVYRIAAERFDARAGLTAALLLSMNWIHLALSMSLRAEVLLPPLALGAWYAVLKGFEGDRRWWFGAGALSGIAYLAKGTGQLFALAWIGAWLLTVAFGGREGRGERIKAGAWFAAGFVPFAAILWWGNFALFGDPTYNFSSKHVMWLDSWNQVDASQTRHLSAGVYLKTHGLSGAAKRLFGGMAMFVPVSIACLSPDGTFPVGYTLRWILLAAGLAAVWGCRRRVFESLGRANGGTWFTAFLYGGFFILFAWYHQVSSSERFIGVLNPIVFVLVAGAFAALWDRIRAALSRFGGRLNFWSKTAVGLAAGVVFASTGIKASVWGLARPFTTDRPPACYREVFERVNGRDGVLYGPSGDLSYYQFDRRPQVIEVPAGAPPPSLAEWLKGKVEMLVVDAGTMERPFLSGHFERAGDRGVRLVHEIPGWRLSYLDPHHAPPHVMIFERSK